MLFPFTIVAIVIGFTCRNKLAKGLLFSIAAALVAVDIAGITMFSIDLPQCTGNFLSGIFCPEDIRASFAYRVANMCAGIWFYGMVSSLFVGAPIGIVALVLEARSRSNGKTAAKRA
jgi:hypothetical protein